MLIRDIFSIPFYIFVIMARFSNCLVYSVVLYYAIKRLRSGKLLLSSIALIPVAIFIASTFSYDYWVTAFTGYSLAYFIGILQEKDKIISYKDMIMIFGSLFLGCGPKAVYFVLGLPFFFIPKMKFDTLKKRKIYYISLVITLLVILCSFAVPFLISTENSTDIRGGSEVNSSEQLKYILTNPLEYMKTLLLFLSNYFTPSVGSTFYAYLGNPNSALYGSIATLIVFWSVFSDKNICDNFTNVKILKFTSFLSVFGALCLISTALYISFTSVGADSIAGVQWRYSIPLFFPFLYSLGSCKVINNMKESVKISIVFIGAFISIFGSFYTAYLMTIL